MFKAKNKIADYFFKIISYTKTNPKKSVVFALLFCLLIFLTIPDNANTPTESENSFPTVEVKSVAEISNADPLTLFGEVRNVNQAELKTEKSGKVTNVYATAGQYVYAGKILAEIDNAPEKAGILSAKGALEVAKANLLKVENGARIEDKINATTQTQNAMVTLQTTQQNARNIYSNAYSTAQNAVFATADTYFNNPRTVSPSFRINSANYEEKQKLKKERVEIESILKNWKKNTEKNIPNEKLNSSLIQAEKDLNVIKIFLNEISYFISKQEINENLTQAQKTNEETGIQMAIANVGNAKTSVTNTLQALASAYSSMSITSLNENKITNGAREEDLLAAKAGVTQARGALASAYAMYEKSIIRAPISGTLTTFNISKGEYVPIQKSVAVIVGNGLNEIETFISEDTLERVDTDTQVIINDKYKGKISSVSPGLDPTTKKARVTILLEKEAKLINGSYAKIKIIAENEEKNVAQNNDFLIPLTAIKVTPSGLAVFTVNKNGKLQARQIAEGPILGSKMLVKKGLSPETKIVVDVRGLSENEKVTVK